MEMNLMTCLELGNHSAKKSFGFKETVSKRNSPDKNLAKPDCLSDSISVGLGRP